MDSQNRKAEISRKEASTHGLLRYFTGKPCCRGHVSDRLVSNATCVECSKTKKLDRHALIRESELQRMSLWQRNNSERSNANAKRCHDKNRDQRLAWGREYRSENKPLFLAKQHKRNAEKLKRTPGWYGELDEFVMREAADLCHLREVATGIKWQVDHAIPLQAKLVCGLHCYANLQVIPALLNAMKGNRLIMTEPLEWMLYGK